MTHLKIHPTYNPETHCFLNPRLSRQTLPIFGFGCYRGKPVYTVVTGQYHGMALENDIIYEGGGLLTEQSKLNINRIYLTMEIPQLILVEIRGTVLWLTMEKNCNRPGSRKRMRD